MNPRLRIDLYLVRLSQESLPKDNFLSQSEKRFLEGLSSPQRKLTFLVGRWLIRKVLAQKLRTSPQKIILRKNRNGKLSLRNDSSLHFSLSHSAQVVALAVSSSPVGLDLEKIVPRHRLTDISKRLFSSESCKRLKTLKSPERLRYFYALWTLHEAFVKLHGKSLLRAKRLHLPWPNDAFAVPQGPSPRLHASKGLALNNSVAFFLKILRAHSMTICLQRPQEGRLSFRIHQVNTE